MNRRVLIVEDDPKSSENLCRLLALKRIQSEVAESFREGLAWVKDTSFDAVVVDLSLPDSEPLQTIERMSELHPSRAIAFTGVDDPALIRECQKRNIRFILKGTSNVGIIREILLIMEWNEPSHDLETALIETAKTSAVGPPPWYQRLVPVIGLTLSLLTASFVGGAALFNTISERATQSIQTVHHFEKLDNAIVLQQHAVEELSRNQRDLQTKSQISIDDRAWLHSSLDSQRNDVIRRLERIEDKITKP